MRQKPERTLRGILDAFYELALVAVLVLAFVNFGNTPVFGKLLALAAFTVLLGIAADVRRICEGRRR